MHYISISDIEIEVERKDIKNMHLSVNPPDGWVRIAIPMNIDDDAVRLFVISKLSWIHKQQRKFDAQPRQSEREMVSGESHYYFGDRYLLNVVYQKGHPKVVIRNKTYIDLYVREGSDLSQRKKVFTEWYRRQLKERIPPLLSKWEEFIGITVDDWQVKQMKTKWGTCNIEERRIWINLELAKKPERCLEYIIVHEMIHLLERHHNERFIALMDQYMPNWRLNRDELNSYPLKHEHWGY
ncbi:MAG: metal-dependent hydrolase [Chloroflexi bacterium HGW-Chloroflexi-3]|nr:MAG: metal-dependent hydrolase [Chloroflexi bacterium HGW-Chloroflexi-3]